MTIDNNNGECTILSISYPLSHLNFITMLDEEMVFREVTCLKLVFLSIILYCLSRIQWPFTKILLQFSKTRFPNAM